MCYKTGPWTRDSSAPVPQIAVCADTDLLEKVWLRNECTGIAHTPEMILMSIMSGVSLTSLG